MLVGKEAQPDRTEQYHGDGSEPARREAFTEQRGAAIELPPGWQQPGQQRRQNERFFVIGAFQQRDRDASGQESHGQQPSGVQPALQAPRQQQQAHADQAADKMRNFQHRQRNQILQPFQPRFHLRSRGREQQHRATNQRQQGEHMRQQHRCPWLHRARQPQHPFPVVP